MISASFFDQVILLFTALAMIGWHNFNRFDGKDKAKTINLAFYATY